MTSVRIANCSGFYGDRLSAAREMVEGGPIDVLTGDYLAELTMYILAKTQERRPNGGYASTFVTQMEQVLETCLTKNIKVVSNAGGLDPHGCATAIEQIAEKVGLAVKVAVVTGDNIRDRLPAILKDNPLRHLDTGESLGDKASNVLTANVYLGGWGIKEALDAGADVVITGRVTDAAMVVGPAAWHHGWERTDWDRLAGAVTAGHIIECGTQATGGNYSFFTEIPDLTRAGFPWVDMEADGSFTVGKHVNTGGQISVGTITSQLLYEIGGHRYANPDVVTRFDTIQLEETTSDRVRVFGVRGEPAPDEAKVAMNFVGGYKNSVSLGITGLDVEAKLELIDRTLWEAYPFSKESLHQVTTELIGIPEESPETNSGATAMYRIAVKDADSTKVGRAFSSAVIETALGSIPGFFSIAPPGPAQPYPVYWPALIHRAEVEHVVELNGQTTIVPPAPTGPPASVRSPVLPRVPPSGPKSGTFFGETFGTRSGDKGPNANLGVFARSGEGFSWLEDYLTVSRLKELLPDIAHLPITRHCFGNLWSLNFVIEQILEEGVAASTRFDQQAKGLGEYLRSVRITED
jgi:hypothetical protein